MTEDKFLEILCYNENDIQKRKNKFCFAVWENIFKIFNNKHFYLLLKKLGR